MVAALFVEEGPRGAYQNLVDVDAWGISRDARLYDGQHPVVAHPPCSRWCRLAGLVEARWGHKKGDDGGCFQAALASVRRWGGVLEHPAYSDAWPAHDLPTPSRSGGWQRGMCGGWSCHVEQGRYGHAAKKATWLYAYGVNELPSLRWGFASDGSEYGAVSWCGNKATEERAGVERKRVGAAASVTPAAFKAVLLGIARSVERRAA